MAKVNINVKIESEMKAKMEIIADKESVSYADAVKFALLCYIKEFEKNNGFISEADISQILEKK